jgi:hypothetical protein
MDFRDYYLQMANFRALHAKPNLYYLYQPEPRPKRRSMILHRLGKLMEQAGKNLQERYRSEPRMA